MQYLSLSRHLSISKGFSGLLLFTVWSTGLSFGFSCARAYGSILVSFTSQAVKLPVAFGSSFVTIFPLLISAFAVLSIHPHFLYVICFLRGFMLAVMLQSLIFCFQDGACLAAMLLLFSSLVFSPVLLWYWWRRLRFQLSDFKRDTMLCFMIGLAVCLVDRWFVSPFLVDIMKF